MDQGKKAIIAKAYIAMNLIGQSPCFKKSIRKIQRISGFDVGVYICGETGTGKELTARAIHYLSPRCDRPFIPLSCGGLSEDLIPNELFGHVKGAYTGADSAQAGMIQVADKGTLFLDEIDSLAPKAQISLLRFLQEKEFKSLGSPEIKRADTRIISASNRNLEQCVKAGTFRRDLFYRLDVLRVDLPPLRQRGEDVLLLANHFLNKYTHEFGLRDVSINAVIAKKLLTYNWPGNVRELENCMLKFCLLAEPPELIDASEMVHTGKIKPAIDQMEEIDFQEGFKNAKARAVDRFEKRYLQVLLTKTKGNISQAARIAKKERRTFARLLEKHAIRRIDYLTQSHHIYSSGPVN